uniref:CD166 antigen homolog A-like n=1 Tax=Sinocyclocheilus anshuiensis TaxID=1608454 RepID=A0A671S2Z8_9TELE
MYLTLPLQDVFTNTLYLQSCLLLCVLVSALETVTSKYGDTIEIPCNNGRVVEAEVTFVKWKYDKDGNILVKHRDQNATVSNDVNYKNRVSIKDFSLVITQVAMADQRTFTCMVVVEEDILEYPVQLAIYTIKITTNVDVDEETGLSTTTSTLEYTAVKGDIDAKFTCQVQHIKSANMDSSPLVFTVNYPTEKVNLQVVSQGPFKEGDNVTLKCTADGNPPPSSYNFYINGEEKTVDSSTYTLTNVTRENTGEYKCSLVDNEDIVASVPITVEYLDVVLSSTGKIVKKLGESLEMTVDVKASGTPQTSWKKGNAKLNSLPKFDKLTYSDSGVYECIVSMAGLKKTQTFELVVEGSPVIKNLIKERGEGMTKVLKCAAEGFPKPTVQWSVNGSNVESASEHGKVTYSLTIVPNGNLTVSCTVSNVLGSDSKSINVSARNDQTILAVGIVVGLMLAVLAIGLAYWLYMKKFRQGSWKTGEKEDGSAEESKKLEENQSQKADM